MNQDRLDKRKVKAIIGDSIERSFTHIRPRNMDIPLDVDKIISLVGHRRSGKTSLCHYLIRKLRASMDHHSIVYLNFEDDRLFPLELSDMDTILEAYYEMFPDNKERKVYFFFRRNPGSSALGRVCKKAL